jgi:ankyrin repeat protein
MVFRPGLLALSALFILLLSPLGADPQSLELLLSQPGPSTAERLEALRVQWEADPDSLSKRVARPHGRGRVPLLIFALEKGDIPLASLLLDLDCDPNQVHGVGQRPTSHWAFSSQENEQTRIDLVMLLKEGGADLKATDRLHRNLFHVLVESKGWTDLDLLKKTALLLKSEGVVLEAEDTRGFTPLLAAVMRHDAPMVKVLLEIGADPNRQSQGLGLDAVTLAQQQSHTIDHPKEAKEVLDVLSAY